MLKVKEELSSSVPITNIESWIRLGKRKSVKVVLPYSDFEYLYPEGEPMEDDLKILHFRGLSDYEFNTSIYEALAVINDSDLTDYVVTSESKSVFDPKFLPKSINKANFRRFMYELDYILIWKSCRDFHRIYRDMEGINVSMPVDIEDIRKLNSIRRLAIIVYYLSGYTKEIGEMVEFFREDGEGPPDRGTPFQSGMENRERPNELDPRSD